MTTTIENSATYNTATQNVAPFIEADACAEPGVLRAQME